MKKIIRVATFSIASFLAAGYLLPAYAQSLLPKEIEQIFNLLGAGGSGAAGFLTSRIQLGLVLALGAVVLVAVIFAISAAIKYISSQGDAGKIEEAQKAIKAIFLGVGAMLIAIVGIILVFVFFGATRPDPSLFQTCLSAPNSVGCDNCLETGDAEAGTCGDCEAYYEEIATGGSPARNDDCHEPISN
ncbi:MAG: hypothetical protein ACE5DX_04830 [Candidatus Dojkabacteria bacterium]